MKLYYSPGACSLSPHIVLAEAGLAADLVKVSLQSHKLEDGSDYYAVNSKGQVPALRLDDGSLLTEGPVIVQYIADQSPQSGLAPACGTPERYRLQEWLNYITSELHKTLGTLFDKSITDDYRKATHDKIVKRIAWIAAQLGDKPYLMGDKFSVADAYLFTMLTWQDWLKFDIAPLQAYFDRVKARPKVAEVLKSEGRLK
ncbi:MAG: glutathione transferase GstA [Betaproteobacteria bacterium]